MFVNSYKGGINLFFNNKNKRIDVDMSIEDEIDLIKKKLIESVHSSKDAQEYFQKKIRENDINTLENLLKIADDFDDFGDSAGAACYYIKDFSNELLEKYEEVMAEILMNDDRWARSFLAIALAKLKSERAKNFIYNINKELSDNWIFVKAVEYYQD